MPSFSLRLDSVSEPAVRLIRRTDTDALMEVIDSGNMEVNFTDGVRQTLEADHEFKSNFPVTDRESGNEQQNAKHRSAGDGPKASESCSSRDADRADETEASDEMKDLLIVRALHWGTGLSHTAKTENWS